MSSTQPLKSASETERPSSRGAENSYTEPASTFIPGRPLLPRMSCSIVVRLKLMQPRAGCLVPASGSPAWKSFLVHSRPPHFGPLDWVRVLFGDRELLSGAGPTDTRAFSTSAEKQQAAGGSSSRHKRVVRRRLGSLDRDGCAHGREFLRNVRSLRRMRVRIRRGLVSVRGVRSGSLGQGDGGQI